MEELVKQLAESMAIVNRFAGEAQGPAVFFLYAYVVLYVVDKIFWGLFIVYGVFWGIPRGVQWIFRAAVAENEGHRETKISMMRSLGVKYPEEK